MTNIQDSVTDGRTPSKQRFHAPVDGPIWPFGAACFYKPISQRDQSRHHQFGKKDVGRHSADRDKDGTFGRASSTIFATLMAAFSLMIGQVSPDSRFYINVNQTSHKCVNERLTKSQQTSRPDSTWSEWWTTMSKKGRRASIQKSADDVKSNTSHSMYRCAHFARTSHCTHSSKQTGKTAFEQPKCLLEVEGQTLLEFTPGSQRKNFIGCITTGWFAFRYPFRRR